jgi:hypothetical protein
LALGLRQETSILVVGGGGGGVAGFHKGHDKGRVVIVAVGVQGVAMAVVAVA